MASAPVMPPNRHVEFKKGGLVPAIATVIATVAVFLAAFLIHQRTYREPTDVMMRQQGGEAGHGESGHAAAPAANAGGQTGGGHAAPAGAPAAAGHSSPGH